MPVCPQCSSGKKARKAAAGIYYCERCGVFFDNDPDEGGNYHDDPTKRIELARSA